MTEAELRAKAERLRALHGGPGILVLPNAWDVASARLFARHPACRAIATSSAGVAAALGYPDGERIPRTEMIAAVARIALSLDLPVTADLEVGYGEGAEAAAATAEAALGAGAVGLNLEDATGDPARPLLDLDAQLEKIAAVVETGARVGVPLVLNARTDVFLAQVGAPEGRLEEAVRRGRAFLEAGADCVFVPGVADAETIGLLVAGLGGPLNVLAVGGTPPVAELERLGVRRVSVGSGPMRATLALVERVGAELLEQGRYDAFTGDQLPYPELARLLA